MEFGRLVVRVEGVCGKCLAQYTRTLFSMETRRLFQIIDYCPCCHYPITINPYNISQELRDHKSFIHTQLLNKERILICGEFSDLIKSNIFDLDYSAVTGVIDINCDIPGSFVGDKQIFDINDIAQLNPEVILVADGSLNADYELKIVLNSLRSGEDHPFILHTIPSELMRVQKITTFFIRLSHNLRSDRLKRIIIKSGIFIVRGVSYSGLLLSWIKKPGNRKKIGLFLKHGLSHFFPGKDWLPYPQQV